MIIRGVLLSGIRKLQVLLLNDPAGPLCADRRFILGRLAASPLRLLTSEECVSVSVAAGLSPS